MVEDHDELSIFTGESELSDAESGVTGSIDPLRTRRWRVSGIKIITVLPMAKILIPIKYGNQGVIVMSSDARGVA